MLAIRADGSFRDGVGLLDQMASLSTSSKLSITADLVEATLGLAPLQTIDDIVDCIKKSDLGKLITILDSLEQSGVQTSILIEQLLAVSRAQAAKSDIYITLLDALLDVSASPYPQHKLLTALAGCMKPRRQSSAALHVASPTVTLPNPTTELEAKAIEEKPAEIEREVVEVDEPKVEQTDAVVKKATPTANAVESIDWDKLIEYMRQNYVAIYSVLNKCHHEIEGGVLNIYTGNAFYKKKLDDPKYRTNLHKSLEAIGVPEIDIETIPKPAPIKDSAAAAVAAIMGGGEEVSI